MSKRPQSAPLAPVGDRRDSGSTLVELLVSIGMLGLIAGVIAAAVSVVFRTERPVNTLIGESHDVQQAVNYFHLDVEGGPSLVAEWVIAGTRGTGCSTAGDQNVVRFDVDDERGNAFRRIAYRMTVTTSGARLDRHECTMPNGSGGFLSESTLNIADRLDTSSGPAVTVSVVPRAAPDAATVDRVVMRFAQTITDEDFSATPRAGRDVASEAAPCEANPLRHALGFGAFVEGNVRIQDVVDSTKVIIQGSLAVGGVLSWQGQVQVADATVNNMPGFTTVGLYANQVDWASNTDPASSISMFPGGSNRNAVLGLPYHVVSGNPNRAYKDIAAAESQVITRGNFFEVTAVTPNPVDFALQFGKLEECADALGRLPAGADAAFIDPKANLSGSDDYPGAGNPGGANLYLDFPDAVASVLNLTETQLASIATINKTSGSPLANGKPLVVNVVDVTGEGNVTFNFATASWQNVGDAKFVLYNFPNATGTVTFEQGVYGTIFAPYSHVVTRGYVQGAVVAKSWLHEGGVTNAEVDNREAKLFAGDITWF